MQHRFFEGKAPFPHFELLHSFRACGPKDSLNDRVKTKGQLKTF